MHNVLQVLADCGAMLTGHFLLSSGKHSSHYFQCARLLQYPEKAGKVLALPVGKLLEHKKTEILAFDCVLGPAMGGILPAYEIARQLGVSALFTERDDNGNMTLRRGFEIEAGTRVLIAEDVITTGRSTLEAAKVVESMGGIIAASVCIVDRRLTDDNPFSWGIYSALRQKAVAWDYEDCPLCKEGLLPLIKPGSRKTF